MTFTDYIKRRVTDTPNGDFVEDTKSLISIGKFPDVQSLDQLLAFMSSRSSTCREAKQAAKRVWRNTRERETMDDRTAIA
jgi:hypothetical protein